MRGTAHLRIARAARLGVHPGGMGAPSGLPGGVYHQIWLVSDDRDVASIRVFHKVSTGLRKVWITLGPGDGAGRAMAVIRSRDQPLQTGAMCPCSGSTPWIRANVRGIC
jgi:hypothetical protein